MDSELLASDWVAIVAFALLVILVVSKRSGRKTRGREKLDVPLYWWNKDNALTVRNLLAGGILALGRTDSGKTSSMKSVAKAILAYGNSSMLVMCAKQGEADDWVALCEATGRSADVVRINERQPWRFNMIGYAADRQHAGPDATMEIVRFISELRTVIFRESESPGGESQQWRKQDERAIMHAVNLLQIAGTPVTPHGIHEIIMTAPTSPESCKDKAFRETACGRAIREGYKRPKTPIQQNDFGLASDYFVTEWPSMADRTRSSIVVGVICTLTAMNTGMARELFANYSNVTPQQAIEGRKIVIVDLPPDDKGDLGIIANVGFKYHWQREILRRTVTENSPISCIWGDEASLWMSGSDVKYLSRCRSYRGCMVYITQSLDSLREVMPGDKGKSAIEALCSNFSHKLTFALGDSTTAAWAAELCGKELQAFASGSVQHGENRIFTSGKPQYSAGFSQQRDFVVQPGALMNGLRTGSALNDYQVDALLLRSGVPFSNRLPMLRVSFDQRM